MTGSNAGRKQGWLATVMQETEKPVDREALYNEVWTEPMVVIAPCHGLFDVGPAKICRSLSWIERNEGEGKVSRLSTFRYNPGMPSIRSLSWVGSAKKDLAAMPEDVQDIFGYALHLAQAGGKHSQAKPLKGFKGAGVLEKWWKIIKATPTAPYTRCATPQRCMCCIASRRNRPAASLRPSPTLT